MVSMELTPAMNAMLESIELHRYRGFESYRLADLACGNLVVGKNNCGKTSILEAVELLVSGGRVSALRESAMRRGRLDENMSYRLDVSPVFYGHRCTPGASFQLSSRGSRQRLDGKILPLEDIGDIVDRWSVMAERRGWLDSDEEPPIAFGLSLVPDGQQPIVLPITAHGSLIHRFRAHSPNTGYRGKVAHFLNFEPSSMRSAWDDVLAEGREVEIVEAMCILMPEIDSIHFLAGSRHPGILVGKRGVKPRQPVGSYGDGMRRLLAVSLALSSAKNGCLLVDEIDTGLHWTVMEDMWRLVVETAQRSNVQVFATTHSSDCITGLGALIRSRPDLAKLVTVQRIHQSLGQAVCVAGEDIAIAMEQDIEVR